MAGATGRDDVERRIVERATSDSAFRQQLMSDPRGALEAELGVSLPLGVNVNVVEESTSDYYLVLPAAGAAAGAELTEEELGAVAGGNNSWNDVTCLSSGRC
jgi:hypothetical protein